MTLNCFFQIAQKPLGNWAHFERNFVAKTFQNRTMWSHYTPQLPPPSPATPSSFRCRSSARRWGLVMTHKFIFLSTPLSITFVIAVFFFFFCFAQFYIHRRASKNTKQASKQWSLHYLCPPCFYVYVCSVI